MDADNKIDAENARNVEGYRKNMLGKTKMDKKRTKWIRDQVRETDVIWCIKLEKRIWLGHLARRTDNKWTNRCAQ